MNASVAGLNLVAARSPAVDRRSLSQAWYSALHLAARKSFAGHSPRVRPAQLCHPEPVRLRCAPLRVNVVEGQRASGKVAAVPRLRASATPYARDEKEEERRAQPLRLAKDIAAKIKNSPHASRFIIETPRGRVMVHVLRRDESVHLLAFCGAAVREDVEKALAQARFALAGMGVRAL